jgi:tetratricopeptide (TPR) repeat protein
MVNIARAVSARWRRVMVSLVVMAVCGWAKPAAAAGESRYLRGEVVVVGDLGDRRPEKGVKLWLRETGDPQVSREGGQFRLYVPPRLRGGSRITIEADKKGFRIWQPLEGEARVPDDLERETIEVRLLPVGSKLFLTGGAIERLIADAATRSRDQITRESRSGQVDLGRYIREWATKYGLSVDDVKMEVDRWATEVENNRRGDLLMRSRAAFARGELAEAERLSHDAAESALAQLKGLQNQARTISDQERAARELAVSALKAEGDAGYTSLRFEAAVAAYRRVLGIVNRQDDPWSWAGASLDVARSEMELGIRVEGPTVHEHLGRARDACENALQVYTRLQYLQGWALAENILGGVLEELGTRTAAPKGNELLGQAADAFRASLQVRTREQLPQEWAATQGNLGGVLIELGRQMAEPKGNELLAQGAEAYRLVLQVYTREQHPQEWAMAQNNLGLVLDELGMRTAAPKGNELLAQAADAFRATLQVRTREQHPQEWAATQSHLGYVLADLGTRTSGPKGNELLEQAADACQSALQVYTRREHPQGWAMAQDNLGIARRELGSRTEGPKGDALLRQAVDAFRAALQVRTREQLPQDWAATQWGLGGALGELGVRMSEPKGNELLGQAADAFRLALLVYTRDASPLQWASAHGGLARASMPRGDFAQAVESAANALVYLPEDRELMMIAGEGYHDRLFAFAKAYTIFAGWVEKHPDDGEARADLAEACITTGRTAEALQHVQVMRAWRDVEPAARVSIAAIEVVARARGDDRYALKASVQALADAVVGLRTTNNKKTLEAPLWSFSGTVHAVETSPAFASNRTWLLPLLHTFDGTDVSKIAKEVETALAKLQK